MTLQQKLQSGNHKFINNNDVWIYNFHFSIFLIFVPRGDHRTDNNVCREKESPFVNIYLNTDLYEYIERAFVMPNPQIKFRLEFRQSIQYEGFTLTFNKPIENFELLHQTLKEPCNTASWDQQISLLFVWVFFVFKTQSVETDVTTWNYLLSYLAGRQSEPAQFIRKVTVMAK